MSATQTRPDAAAIPTDFQPRIVAFVCKWCTYAGADLAGTSRMEYPANVRTIMLPCTGRIDVSFVLRAFLHGADGVIVSGCHPGDCHYTAGNYRARRRWTLFRDLMDTLGFDLRRLELAWISAAEGAKWVKTITAFTDKIRQLGPYEAMHNVAGQLLPAAAPPASGNGGSKASKATIAPADPALQAAVAESLDAGKVKAVIGWTAGGTLRKPRPAWITTAEATSELVAAGSAANLARLFKNPKLKNIAPLGIIARSEEILAINVLMQESQLDGTQVTVFALGPDGKYLGAMDVEAATQLLQSELRDRAAAGEPVGFAPDIYTALDGLMSRTPQERWKFWAEQSARCLKCYACRGSCPMCSCEQCFSDKNQPQWFPTAADGPGNFAWHIMRAFHLAGRCVGCGACQDACPARIPLNLLSAAMARSALKHFEHRAGTDPKAPPLQSDFRPDDKEDYIL